MKVLFITSWYPTKDQPIYGVFVREHAKAVSLYDEVLVLHCAGPRPSGKGLFRIEQETDRSVTEGMATYRVQYNRPHIQGLSPLLSLYSTYQAFRFIVKQSFRPDIIHAHVYRAGLSAALIGKVHRIPVVISEHSTAFPRRLLSRQEAFMARLAFRGARRVLPVSRTLQKAIEDYGIRTRFRVIPNAVDTNLFFPLLETSERHRPKRILFVGFLIARKGLPYLLHGLADLREQLDGWQLAIAGDGPLRMEYQGLTKALGLNDKVVFHGVMSKQDIAELMRRSEFLVLPSLCENLPCVLLEAMASGLPIVSTRTGGIPEIVDEEVGILVEHGNSKELANALSMMAKSSHMFDRKLIARKAQEYSAAAVGKLLHSTYIECTEKR